MSFNATPLLGPKHQGMRVSAEGMLGRIRDGRDIRSHRFMAGELLKHLKELATRYYAGDLVVVDEFLQLYCLDDTRPNATEQVRADIAEHRSDQSHPLMNCPRCGKFMGHGHDCDPNARREGTTKPYPATTCSQSESRGN